MSNAAANFLQGANAANAAMASSAAGETARPAMDENMLLGALLKLEGCDLEALASELGRPVGEVGPAVEKLSSQGLIEACEPGWKLSRAGERALRYMNLAGL